MITDFLTKPFEKYNDDRVQLQSMEDLSPVSQNRMPNSYLMDSLKHRNQKITALSHRIAALRQTLIPYDYEKKISKLIEGQFLNVKGTKHLFFGGTSIYQSSKSLHRQSSKVAQGLCEIFFDDGSYLIGFFYRGQLQKDFIYILQNGNYINAKLKKQIAKNSFSGFRTDDTQSLDSQDENSSKDKIDQKNIKLRFYQEKQSRQNSKLECQIQFNDIHYQGTIEDGLFNGNVLEIGKDYQFTGVFYKGQRRKGKLISKLGFEYEGTFLNNKFDGLGVLVTKDGIYNGEFKNGLKQGEGQFKWEDGSTYKGDFHKDQRHGKGYYKSKQGSFKGQWRNDQIDGAGYLVVDNVGVGGQWRKNIYQKPNKFF